MTLLRFVLSSFLIWSASSVNGEPIQRPQYDVVVYGGTSSGVVAAVQVARMGRSVVLIEPGKHLGGLTSSGLGRTDSGNTAVIGGAAREFYQRVKRYYDNDSAWRQQKKEQYGGYSQAVDAIWCFEPKVAELIYKQMLDEAAVPVVKGQRLDLKDGVVLKDNRIAAIRCESGQVFSGRMFIDATYEGDLMAKAGVYYHVGREPNAKYGETINGVQKRLAHYHIFKPGVDPYVKPGDPSSGLLPGVHNGDPGQDGQGDTRIQAYCFRMCLTDAPQNRVPFAKPEGYEELRYELLFRNFEAGETNIPWLPGNMPNRKTDTNNKRGFSTDNIGRNYDYPEGDYKTRAAIIADHELYQKGLMWALAYHPRVPEHIRREVSRWGLAKDEFVDNGNWPHQLYVREARRMVGEYVMTEHDCRRRRVAEDSVGLGSYNMDSHHCQRYVTPEGFVQNEGDVEISPGGAYVISYRSLVPRRGEAQNLLVPVCVSASHISYGSIRMEPVFMILGQSAATAAVQALDDNISVQDVDYAKLRKRLLEDKQVLDLPSVSASRAESRPTEREAQKTAWDMGVIVPQKPVTARITLTPNIVTQEISPLMYGSNVMWWEGFTANFAGNQPPRAWEIFKEIGLTCLRFPGGADCHPYRWDSLAESVRVYKAAGFWEHYHTKCMPENNYEYTKFLDLCKKYNIEPILQVSTMTQWDGKTGALGWTMNTKNLGEIDAVVQYAADWVRDAGKKGYKVKYWEIGNEEGCYPTMTGDRYGQWVKKFVHAMKAADPTIKIIATGHRHEWNKGLLKQAGKDIDYLSWHYWSLQKPVGDYPPGMGLIPCKFFTADDLKKAPDDQLYLAHLAALVEGKKTMDYDLFEPIRKYAPEVKVAWTEWSWPAFGSRFNYSIAQALLNMEQFFHMAAQDCRIANYWAVTGLNFQMIRYWDKYPYYPMGDAFRLLRRYAQGRLREVKVETSLVTVKDAKVPLVTAYACEKDKAWSLFILNHHPSQKAKITLPEVAKFNPSNSPVTLTRLTSLYLTQGAAANSQRTDYHKVTEEKLSQPPGPMEIELEPHSLYVLSQGF